MAGFYRRSEPIERREQAVHIADVLIRQHPEISEVMRQILEAIDYSKSEFPFKFERDGDDLKLKGRVVPEVD